MIYILSIDELLTNSPKLDTREGEMKTVFNINIQNVQKCLRNCNYMKQIVENKFNLHQIYYKNVI